MQISACDFYSQMGIVFNDLTVLLKDCFNIFKTICLTSSIEDLVKYSLINFSIKEGSILIHFIDFAMYPLNISNY
jgi:hypothetical protein